MKLTKQCFAVQEFPKCTSGALLLLRVICGVAFMMHGWGKIQNPFGWMGPDATIPGFLLALAAISEFGGGLAWILGLLTKVASLGIALTMAVAVYMHAVVFGDPFVKMTAEGGSYEPALIFLAIALLFMNAGPGTFSLDQKIFGKKEPCTPKA